MRNIVILFLIALIGTFAAEAQQCPAAPILGNTKGFNLFTDEQEVEFGNIVAEQVMATLRVIEVDEVSGRLQQIVDRLEQQMPPTRLKFRAYVIDAPYNNAFTLPGGRIFVTKKMIAFTRSEDELAGVLAHELGHQVTHQIALDWSRLFRDMLGVTKLGDRADIEEKYHQYLEMYRTKEGLLKSGDQADKEQLGADQVAVFAVAKAGYSPQAVVDFWDRFAETKGKKGNWFSDMLGNTWPESKRLREFATNLGSVPRGCAQASHSNAADYVRWQTTVKNYNGFGKKEDLHGIAVRKRLEPALRNDLKHIRFSPDGRYLLGQDDASIFVLSTHPLANILRIDAPDAHPAMFSPDSQSVVFYDGGLHVERWSIAEKRPEEVDEVHVLRGCIQTALSPDGAYLACVIPNHETYFPLDLTLFNVATGQPALAKKSFIGPAMAGYHNYFNYLMLQSGRPAITMAFSPDGKYFIANRAEAHLLVDLTRMSELPLSGDLRKYTMYNFAFVGPDLIIGADNRDGAHGAVVEVPSGRMLDSDIPIGPLALFPAAKGDYAILRPIPKAPVGIMNLKTKKVFLASKTDAMDIYEGRYASERVNGEIGLYDASNPQQPLEAVLLPPSPLSRVYSAALSPDAKTFALSDRTRGAVWDIASGQRLLYVRGFRGAHYADRSLFLDFIAPEQFMPLQTKDESNKDAHKREAETPDHSLARAEPTEKKIAPLSTFQRRNHIRQAGSVVLIMTPANDEEPFRNITMEAKDFETGASLWKRQFPKSLPAMYSGEDNDTFVLSWYLGASGAKDELRDDPDTKKLVDNIKDSEGSYLVEIVDARKGTVIGKFPIDTGKASFRVRDIYANGGLAVVTDSQQRALLYSYKGERKGRVFGKVPALAGDGRVLCVEREPGRLVVYDLPAMKEIDQFTFGAKVVYDFFTSDHKLIVLTDDQTLFELDLSAGRRKVDTAKN